MNRTTSSGREYRRRSFARRKAVRTGTFVALSSSRKRIDTQSPIVTLPVRISWRESEFADAEVSFWRNVSLSKGVVGFEALSRLYNSVSKNTDRGTRNDIGTGGPQ